MNAANVALQSSAYLFLILAAVALSACGPRYFVDGQTFSTKKAALAHVRQEIQQGMVTPVSPLPSPIGESVVFVTPPQPRIHALYRADYPYLEADTIDMAAEGEVMLADAFKTMIERRNLFDNVAVVWAETPAGVDVPANGYLIWQELPNASNRFFHMMAAGQSETSDLNEYIDLARLPKDGDIGLFRQVYLPAIEEFVRTHRPSA